MKGKDPSLFLLPDISGKTLRGLSSS